MIKQFINLSNHPTSKWSPEQRAAVFPADARVIDISFPQVDPCLSAIQVYELAEKYMYLCVDECNKNDISSNETVVHIMGELGFVYQCVKLLIREGFIPLHSTTSRETVEEKLPDGTIKKTAIFKFVQFRPYDDEIPSNEYDPSKPRGCDAHANIESTCDECMGYK